MKPFRARAFLDLLQFLLLIGSHKYAAHVSGRIDSLSQGLAKLPQLANLPPGYAGGLVEAMSAPGQNWDDLGDVRRSGLRDLSEMELDCISLELIASLATVRKLKTVIAQPNSLYSDLYPLAEELRGRLIDEMENKCFWALTTREREYYEQPKSGWEEIIARFPDSLSDVEEASKCFALSRYAAAVFHSVQVVEIGLIELGRVIVATDPQTGWNATTNRLKKILATKYPDRTPFQQQYSQFLEQISATIEALNSAWRNKISHAQNKLALLTSDFTPEVAEEIMLASRSFMRRLATDAPTSPDPDA